jgi:hypothetical protein
MVTSLRVSVKGSKYLEYISRTRILNNNQTIIG